MKKKFFLVTLFSGALLLLFIRFRSEMPDREKVASAQDSEEAVQLLRILDKAWNEGNEKQFMNCWENPPSGNQELARFRQMFGNSSERVPLEIQIVTCSPNEKGVYYADAMFPGSSVPVRAHIRETENGKKLIRLED